VALHETVRLMVGELYIYAAKPELEIKAVAV
jgi:hypothetical protein